MVWRIKDGSPGSIVNGCGVVEHDMSGLSFMADRRGFNSIGRLLIAEVMKAGGFAAKTKDCVRRINKTESKSFIEYSVWGRVEDKRA